MRTFATIALVLLATTAHAATLDLPWPVAARRVHAIAVDGDRVYLATGDNRAELLVVDIDTGETLGAFDAEGGADALSVRVIRPGIVKLGRRQSDAPEVYRLDVSDPAHIVVLETGEREHNVRWKPVPPSPVRFRDVNGDGVFRLACLGDSNTVPLPALGIVKWCEMLAAAIDDPRFEIVNLGWGGATVCPNLKFASDAAQQMDAALAADVDAVVLAFGTNDRLQGRSVDEIVDAYGLQASVAAEAGVAFFVATTPPMGGCSGEGCAQLFALHERLEDAYAGHAIDFFTGFAEDDFKPDRIHLNDAGQARRAERALAVIESPLRAGGR